MQKVENIVANGDIALLVVNENQSVTYSSFSSFQFIRKEEVLKMRLNERNCFFNSVFKGEGPLLHVMHQNVYVDGKGLTMV